MERSLSVLLPVRDVQSTLQKMVFEMLEVLPELTSRFELIVIDDGSRDATLEVADDLATCYPQVHAVHHAEARGHVAAIRTGLQHSSGDIVFLRDPREELALDEISKLWWAIDEHPLVLGRAATSAGRWRGWKRRGGAESFCMVDRQAIQATQKSLDQQAQLIASRGDRGGTWFEVEITQRGAHRPAGPTSSRKGALQPAGDRNERRPPASRGSPAEKDAQPKYLRRLRDSALGK